MCSVPAINDRHEDHVLIVSIDERRAFHCAFFFEAEISDLPATT
jgi:hypothetical protein